jgi:hypothetical protein
LKGLIVALNNQEVFWAQNYPENRSNISSKMPKKVAGGRGQGNFQHRWGPHESDIPIAFV